MVGKGGLTPKLWRSGFDHFLGASLRPNDHPYGIRSKLNLTVR